MYRLEVTRRLEEMREGLLPCDSLVESVGLSVLFFDRIGLFFRRVGRKKGLLFAAQAAAFMSSHAGAAGTASEPPSEEVPAAEVDEPAVVSSLQPPAGILPRITWSPTYRRVGAVDYALTGLGTVAAVVTRLVGPHEDGPRGGAWIDEDVRGSLRASGSQGRLVADRFSDLLLWTTSSYGILGDPFFNAGWLRHSPDAASQLFWINAEVVALTFGIQQATSNWVGRERPYGRTCGTTEQEERAQACEERDRYRSYFSGHTAVPFSVAAATCMNHVYLPLSGGSAWVPCSVGFAVAAASGTLRIVADKHYATDVMTGVLVGTSVGILVPLLHYAVGVPSPKATWGTTEVLLLPLLVMEGKSAVAGASVVGVLP